MQLHHHIILIYDTMTLFILMRCLSSYALSKISFIIFSFCISSIHSDFIQFIDALKSTPSVSKYRPPFLIRTLQSRACRSAIMFGDELTNAEGKALIFRLSNCSMPFICAHGRPTLAPM